MLRISSYIAMKLYVTYVLKISGEQTKMGHIWWKLIPPGIYQYYDTHLQDETGKYTPDSKVHGANMGPIWGRQGPGGPHVGPINFAIWDWLTNSSRNVFKYFQHS